MEKMEVCLLEVLFLDSRYHLVKHDCHADKVSALELRLSLRFVQFVRFWGILLLYCSLFVPMKLEPVTRVV